MTTTTMKRRPHAGRTAGGDLGAALDLLERSRATLALACGAEMTTDRYCLAHVGALRAGAALLAARRPARGGRENVWEGLTRVAPELGEWAAYLAVCGDRRAVLERGGGYATPREADDLLRGAETFLGLVQAALGLPVTRVRGELAVAGLG